MNAPRTYRMSVTVASSKHAGWFWLGLDYPPRHGFKRMAQAMRDAESVVGPIDWTRKGNQWRGDYGPHLTPDEWLNRQTGER